MGSIKENIIETFIVLDPDSKIRTVHKAACELLGYKEEELIGNPVHVVLPATEETLNERKLDELIKGDELKNYETYLKTKDGKKIPILFNGSVMKDKEGNIDCIVCTARETNGHGLAEEASRESENKFRGLVENSIVGVYLIQDGVFKYVNSRFAEIHGYEIEELANKMGTKETTLPEDLPIVEGNISKRMEGENESIHYEFRIVTKTREIKNVEVFGSRTMYQGRPAVIGTLLDVTERKRGEEALRESESRFRLLVEHSTDTFLLHDFDGRIIDVNQHACESLGYTREELLGLRIQDIDEDFIPGKHAEKWKQMVPGVPTTLEGVHKRKDGMTFPIEVRLGVFELGGRKLMLGLVRDITDRKRSEEAAKRLAQENAIMAEIGRIISSTLNIEEVYERFADEVLHVIPFDRVSVNIINPDRASITIAYSFGIKVGDIQEGDVLPLDDPFNENIVSKRQGVLIQPEDESELAKSYPNLVKHFRIGIRSVITVPLISKDQVIGILHIQSLKPNAYTESDVRLAERVGNEIAGAIANAQLFAERKQAEEAKAVLQEQLRQSQKMESIGQLAGGVAHDFNNILTVIHGYSELVMNSLDPGSPLRDDVKEIKTAAERASALTRQLLAFSRKQMLQPKVIDLNALVPNMVKMLRRMIGEGIELNTVWGDDLGSIKADPGQIEQVILNLAVNARDAMPNGGKLTVETANVELDEDYANLHLSIVPGPYVMLSVSDTGVGMTPEVRERVLEPFFTTKEKGKGTGLGLSTVYGIVKQSGGNIWIYSEPGQGSTFKIYLPRVEEEADSMLQSSVVGTKPKQCSETILLVEDEKMVRNLALTILKRQGYNVLEAENGDAALRIVQEQNGNPIHLMLTDVVMPGMSGHELSERLKTQCPGMKVIYMSGYTDEAIIEKHGLSAPGIHYIQKPFPPDTLVKKIRSVLDGPRPRQEQAVPKS